MDVKQKNLSEYKIEYVQKIEDTKRKIIDAKEVLSRRDSGGDSNPSKGYLAQKAKVEKLERHLQNQEAELQKLIARIEVAKKDKTGEKKSIEPQVPQKPNADKANGDGINHVEKETKQAAKKPKRKTYRSRKNKALEARDKEEQTIVQLKNSNNAEKHNKNAKNNDTKNLTDSKKTGPTMAQNTVPNAAKKDKIKRDKKDDTNAVPSNAKRASEEKEAVEASQNKRQEADQVAKKTAKTDTNKQDVITHLTQTNNPTSRENAESKNDDSAKSRDGDISQKSGKKTKGTKTNNGSAIGPVTFWLLMCAFLALDGLSGYKLITGINNYREAKQTYAAIAEMAVVSEPKAEGFKEEMIVDKPVLTITGGEDGHAAEASVYDGLDVPQVDFDGLLSQDKNVIGWISIPALQQGYPIMAGKDNEYYLHKTLGGKELYAGSIFIETKNNKDFNDPNTFIYGHNMKNGTMFGSLSEFGKQEVYDSFPAFWIITPDKTARLYHIFSMHEVQTESETYKLFTDHGKLLEKWAQAQQSESLIKTDDIINENSKIVTLSTCTTGGSNRDRFVVQGTLVYETKTT